MTKRFKARWASRLDLPSGYPSIEVGLGLWQMVSLGKHDEVQHVVETPVATSVEAMARVAG